MAKEIFNDLNLVLRLNQHIGELTATEASATALLCKESSFQVLAELASIEVPDPREEAQFDHQRAGFHTASALPFHLQGDQTFNEASALARRRQLRHSDIIKQRIQFLWQVARGRNAVAELTHGTDTAPRKLSGTNRTPTAMINEREYTDMMLLIFKVLRDDFVLETAQLQIQCDWEVDSHHGSVLVYDQFFPALFELVDVWTCDILEATYARFLELLTRRITLRVIVFLDDMKLKLALSDNFDEAVVVKAIPLSTIKQFASVAKVMQGTGVRTVGDLAAADPRAVEKQRKGYLARNSFSPEKIGADLEHLLQMFRDVSEQFQDANYALRNKVLQRVPLEKGTGRSDGETCIDSFGSNGGQRVQGIGGTPLVADNASGSFASGRLADGDPAAGEGHVVSEGGGMKRVVGSNLNAETELVVRRGGIKRINTFRDITATETGVLDALKASFLIEKGISIQRKSSIDAIKAELIKFGVDPKSMDNAAIHDNYDRLYEMFVLRDGDNIKSLAGSILARIKMELAAHGIEVNEEEMEALYDGFYGSVVVGSGERIVADAKNWVDETVDAKSYSTYVKQEYHELKSIYEVKLVGSGAEDEEFASLLSKEDDQEHESTSTTAGKKLDSPIQKEVASLSRRPSLYRRLADSPKKDKDQSLDTIGARVPSGAVLITENRSNSNTRSAHDELQSSGLGTTSEVGTRRDYQEDVSSGDAPEDDMTHVVSTGLPNTFVDAPNEEDVEESVSATAGENISVSTKSSSEERLWELKKSCEVSNDTQPFEIGEEVEPVVVRHETEDDDFNKRNGIVTLKPSNSRSNLLGDDGGGNLDGNHAHLDEIDREPQGVGFEYEDKVDPPPVDATPVTPERPLTREPKVPDIVVGGSDTGKSIAVTSRYIQLLGLANVVSITSERELMGQLANNLFDLVLYDIGDELDTAVAKAKELIALVGRRVIFLGGDPYQPEKTDVIARLCVSEGGLLYFGKTPIDFPAIRAEIQSFLDATPHLYILRQRRVSSVFSAAAKIVSSSIRATNMIQVDEDHPRSVLTPPLSVDSSSAKRKASSMSPPLQTASLPQVAPPRRETFSPFRPLRVIDEMPGADVPTTKRFTPITPSSHAPKPKGKSPRMSAALKKLMR